MDIKNIEMKNKNNDQFQRNQQINTLKFGKYKGKTIYEVYETDEKYLKWLMNQTFFNENKYNTYMKKSINDLLNGIDFGYGYIEV
jgi:uncharacterized protein (DUF3820 family)